MEGGGWKSVLLLPARDNARDFVVTKPQGFFDDRDMA
jgi:hypothetical protein